MTSLDVQRFLVDWMLTTIKSDVDAWTTPSALILRADGVTVEPKVESHGPTTSECTQVAGLLMLPLLAAAAQASV